MLENLLHHRVTHDALEARTKDQGQRAKGKKKKKKNNNNNKKKGRLMVSSH